MESKTQTAKTIAETKIIAEAESDNLTAKQIEELADDAEYARWESGEMED